MKTCTKRTKRLSLLEKERKNIFKKPWQRKIAYSRNSIEIGFKSNASNSSWIVTTKTSAQNKNAQKKCNGQKTKLKLKIVCNAIIGQIDLQTQSEPLVVIAFEQSLFA